MSTISSASRNHRIGRILSYVALGVAVILVLFPIYWMVATSLKLPRDILRVPSLWPSRFTLNNFDKLLSDGDFLLAIRDGSSQGVAGVWSRCRARAGRARRRGVRRRRWECVHLRANWPRKRTRRRFAVGGA